MEVCVALLVNGYYSFRKGILKDCDKLHINIQEFKVIIEDVEYILPRNVIFENSDDCCEFISKANGGMFL